MSHSSVLAYVLHQRAYRETSAIVEVITREYGRVGVVARGIRSSAKNRSALTPFQRYWLQWKEQGELQRLEKWETDGVAHRLQGTTLVSGLYVNELLLKLIERHDPHALLYDAYQDTVGALATGTMRPGIALRWFEMALLSAIGYGPDFSHERDGETPLSPDACYGFEPDEGAYRCAPDSPGLQIKGTTLLALASGQLTDASQLREAKALMRMLIQYRLQDRTIVSRTLFRAGERERAKTIGLQTAEDGTRNMPAC